MVYSGESQGIFCAFVDKQLLWVDVSNMDNLVVMELGEIANCSSNFFCNNMALVEIPQEEARAHYGAPTDASIAESFVLLEGSVTNTALALEPWNARADVTYTVDDTNVATVNAQGVLTGVSAGKTTLRVAVKELGLSLTAPVKVSRAAGSLYGSLPGGRRWAKVQDDNPASVSLVSGGRSNYSVYAGAYYDGYVYAYARSMLITDQYGYFIVKVDPTDGAVETLMRCHYNVRDMAFDYGTGILYAIVEDNVSTCLLAQVDITTGEVIPVGDTGTRLCALTADDQGRLFAIGENGFLYQVNSETMELTEVGYTGATGNLKYQSMHFDFNTGNTYWAQIGNTSNGLRLVDLETGTSTHLGLIDVNGTQLTSLYTVPQAAPAVPETLEPIGVSLYEKSTVAVGGTVTLNARVLPMSAANVDETLTWTSNDETIATVEDGVVTGVAAGTVTITATTVNGKFASCQVTVTEKERKFYAYDEGNAQWISFTGEDPAAVTVERKDAEGESPISASAWTGDTLYAYTLDGRFYTVNPDTFERTLVGDALYGKTMSCQFGEYKILPVDMSYDAATGKLYAALIGCEELPENYTSPYHALWCQICLVDVTTGDVEVLFENGAAFTANLMVRNDRAYFVDSMQSGMLNYLDLYSEDQTLNKPSLVFGYWGTYYQGRGFILDEYTGDVYTVRDKGSWSTGNHKSTLNIMNLGDAALTELGLIGEGVLVNSLFLR